MKTSSLKPLRRSRSQTGKLHFSDNPIINQFLHLTIDEGHQVRGLSLGYGPGSHTVVFSLQDGSQSTFSTERTNGNFNSWWREAADFVKRLRSIDLSPAC